MRVVPLPRPRHGLCALHRTRFAAAALAAGLACAAPAAASDQALSWATASAPDAKSGSLFTVNFDSPDNVGCFPVPIPCANGNTVQGVTAPLPPGLQFVTLAGRFWGTGYTGATNVLSITVPRNDLWLGFQAAPGYVVRVVEFTLAPRPGVQASQPYRANGVLGWTGDLATATTFVAAPGGEDRSNTFTLFSTFNMADIAIDSITVQVSPIPEPGTWALMTLGAGLVGWLKRRRDPAAAAMR